MLKICAAASVGLFVGLVFGTCFRDHIELKWVIGR